ncbi:hypothetical protein ACISUF_03120, partial [Streptomyces sp. NPDC003090]
MHKGVRGPAEAVTTAPGGPPPDARRVRVEPAPEYGAAPDARRVRAEPAPEYGGGRLRGAAPRRPAGRPPRS